MFFTRPRTRPERGLATLDVLLGMAIFALIVVIGVQNFNTLRQRAIVQSVTSDAKGIADKIQLIGGADGSGPSAAGPRMKSSSGDLMLASFTKSAKTASAIKMTRLADVYDPVAEYDLILTQGNRLVLWATNSPHFGYCIERDPNGPWAAYRSDLGGIYAQGVNGGCKTLDPDVIDADYSTMPQDGEGPPHGPVPIPGTEDETEEPDETDSPSPSPSPTTPAPTTPAPTEEATSPAPTTPVPTETPTTPAPTTPVPTTPVPTTPAPTTPVPTTPVPTTPVPTTPPPLWTDPSTATDIANMCKKNWGTKAIFGNGAIVYGTAGHDIIFAGNGGQIVYGLGGNDLICGGNGKDTLYGGSGSDVLYGGNGKDILYGGSGRDFLHGNNGKDSMYVGDGYEDVAYGGNGSDTYLEDGPDDPEDTFVQQGPNAA